MIAATEWIYRANEHVAKLLMLFADSTRGGTHRSHPAFEDDFTVCRKIAG